MNKLKQDNEFDKEEIEFNKKTTDSLVQNDEELIKKKLELKHIIKDFIKQRDAMIVSI